MSIKTQVEKGISDTIEEQMKLVEENPAAAQKMEDAANKAYEEYMSKSEFEKIRIIRSDYFRLMNEAYTMAKYFETRVKHLDEQLNNLEMPENNDK